MCNALKTISLNPGVVERESILPIFFIALVASPPTITEVFNEKMGERIDIYQIIFHNHSHFISTRRSGICSDNHGETVGWRELHDYKHRNK